MKKIYPFLLFLFPVLLTAQSFNYNIRSILKRNNVVLFDTIRESTEPVIGTLTNNLT